MLEIDQGREIRRIINKKDKYDTFPNEMLDLYLKVKKLMATIASRNQAPNKPSH